MAAVAVWLAIGAVMVLLILTAPWRWAIGVFLFWVPFSGTAVAIVGGDPIILPLLMCLALTLRYAVSLFDKPFRDDALALLGREVWLLAFLGYATVSGLLFPRLFEGVTQSFTNINGAYVLMPLGPGHVSIAQIAYLLLAGASFIALRHAIYRIGPASAMMALLAQVVVLGGLGFLQAVLGLVGLQVPVDWIVTNEAATRLINISEGGFSRVTGVFTEAAAHACWAVGAFGFTVFLYLNKMATKTTLALSVMLAFSLLLSTSSTAYGGLLFLVVAFSLMVAFDADRRRRERGMVLLGLGAAAGVGLVITIFTADTGPLYSLRLALESAIFGKQYSLSAVERGAWAGAALQSGFDTFLLGAGYGAVRSSGVGQMLFGGVGVLGIAFFVMFLAPKLMLAIRSRATPEAAAASACAIALGPAFGVLLISSSDLGLWNMFWYYAAIAAGAWDRSIVMQAQDAADRLAAEPTEAMAWVSRDQAAGRP